jgi:hypothetical protein
VLTSRGNSTELDGSIGPIPSGAYVHGAVTVQRYMHPFGYAHNRYISIPVEGATPLEQLSDDFAVAHGSIRYYDEAIPGVANNGYRTHPLQQEFERGRGYLAWLYTSSSPVTWDVSGALYQGNISLPIHFTPSPAGAEHDGWNLMGNPYPSAIRWSDDASSWTRTEDISPVVYVTDMKDNVYCVYNYVDGTGDLVDGILAMGQAFWVKANAENPSIIIHEKAKERNGNGAFYRQSRSGNAQVIIELEKDEKKDRAFLKVNEHSTYDFDLAYDAYKLTNEHHSISLMDDRGHSLVMHTVPEIRYDDKIFLGIEVSEYGMYTLSIRMTDTVIDELFLVDAWEGKKIRVGAENAYPFFSDKQTVAVKDRFYLVKENRPLEELLPIKVYPNPVEDFLVVEHSENQRIEGELRDFKGREVEVFHFEQQVQLDMHDLAKGIYLLILKTDQGNVIKKVIR